MAKPTLYLGSDHGGWALKESLKRWLIAQGEVVTDCGPEHLDPDDDYPRIAQTVAEHVSADRSALGLLLCRSGQGVAIVANKFPGIRAAVVWNAEVASVARADDDVNVLCLPADYMNATEAQAVVKEWLNTRLKPEPRFQRRLDQIQAIERKLIGR